MDALPAGSHRASARPLPGRFLPGYSVCRGRIAVILLLFDFTITSVHVVLHRWRDLYLTTALSLRYTLSSLNFRTVLTCKLNPYTNTCEPF